MDTDTDTDIDSKTKNEGIQTGHPPESLETPDLAGKRNFPEDVKICTKKMYWLSHFSKFGPSLGDFSLDGVTSSILDYNEQNFINFKKFDVVSDYSDHGIGRRMLHKECDFLSEFNLIIKKHVFKELHDDLPHTQGIFIRSYKTKPHLLRALIIGPKGTPYQDGLFFFDVHLPFSYPSSNVLPTLRLHSAGFQIHPDIYGCGEVSLIEFKTAPLYLKKQGHDPIKILQLLVTIKDVLLNKNPFYHRSIFRNPFYQTSPREEQCSVLYSENVIVKSLKIMIYIMNKPPKHFENFVVGHFRCRAHDILMACEGYMNGRFLNGELEEMCSITFRSEVASCIKPLVDAFVRIGAHEAQNFLSDSRSLARLTSKEVGVHSTKKARIDNKDSRSLARLTSKEVGAHEAQNFLSSIEKNITVPRELGSPDSTSLDATGLTSKEVGVHPTTRML